MIRRNLISIIFHIFQFFLQRLKRSHGLGDQHQALVILGGGIQSQNQLTRNSTVRMQVGVMLYQEWRCPILLSGGPTLQNNDLCEAQAMAFFARKEGVRQEDLILEKNSRNTWENAKHASVLLRERGFHNVMLVTSPQHNLRSFLCFSYFDAPVMVYEGPFPQDLVTLTSLLLEVGGIAKILPFLLLKKVRSFFWKRKIKKGPIA